MQTIISNSLPRWVTGLVTRESVTRGTSPKLRRKLTCMLQRLLLKLPGTVPLLVQVAGLGMMDTSDTSDTWHTRHVAIHESNSSCSNWVCFNLLIWKVCIFCTYVYKSLMNNCFWIPLPLVLIKYFSNGTLRLIMWNNWYYSWQF